MKVSIVLFYLFYLFSVSSSFSMSYFNLGFTVVKQRIEDIIERGGPNTDCARDLQMLMSDFIHKKPWALKMIDASAKPNSGIMKGNFFHTGNYDQCLEIEEHVDDSWTIKGQYCNLVIMPSKLIDDNNTFIKNIEEMIMALRLDIPVTILNSTPVHQLPYGVCLPASCTIGHLQRIWNYAETSLSTKFHVEFQDMFCDYKDKPYPNTVIDVHIWCFFGAILLINLLATIYDVLIYQKVKKPGEETSIITTFSLYTNTKKLFTTTSEESFLQCLNGIRVINMLWIIAGHRLVVNIVSIPINLLDVIHMMKEMHKMLMVSALLSVDSFLFMSGFLVTYIHFAYRSQGKNVTTCEIILGRFVRLMPPLAAVILFYIGVWKYLSSGPYWQPLSNIMSGTCLKYWWRTLFFMDNFSPLIRNCVMQSWYLGVDTQLCIVSPIILYYLSRKPSKTIVMLILAIILSAFYSYMLTIQHNLGAVLFEINADYFNLLYGVTYLRMPPWIIGLIFGYVMLNWREKPINIPKVLVIMLWIASIGGMILIMFPWHKSFAKGYNVYRSAIFNALARPLWSLCIGWIVLACSTGYGGVMNAFLSLPVFNVLGKLTYSAYLTHFGVLVFRNVSRRTPSYLSFQDFIYDLIGDLVIIFLVSMILCLTIESPVISLGRRLLKRRTSNQKVTKATNTKRQKNKKNNIIVCVLPEDLKKKYLKED